MEFYAHHGCFSLERKVGMRFSVDVWLEAPEGEGVRSDRLDEGIIDYQAVYHIVKEQMETPSKIIEHVAHRIVEALYGRFPQLQKATVRVSKIAPSLGGKVGRASVVLSR